MKKFLIKEVKDKEINKYLSFKNLFINRKYSSNKKNIKKLNHYLWWLTSQKLRKSYYISNKNIPIFISTIDYRKYKKFKILYSGMISCLPQTNLFDLLQAIKLQNNYLDKQKNVYCFISIDKKNIVLLKHWKYFGYKILKRNNFLTKFIIKEFKVKKNNNIYYKKTKS